MYNHCGQGRTPLCPYMAETLSEAGKFKKQCNVIIVGMIIKRKSESDSQGPA